MELLMRRERWEVVADLALQQGQVLHAPHLLDAEVPQVLRRFELRGGVRSERAAQALEDFQALRLVRHAHEPRLDRVWELRRNLSAYDGLNVALAEALSAALVTFDRRLAGVTKSPKSAAPRPPWGVLPRFRW